MSYFSEQLMREIKEGDKDTLIECVVDGLDRTDRISSYEVREDGLVEVIFRGDELVPTTRWVIIVKEWE